MFLCTNDADLYTISGDPQYIRGYVAVKNINTDKKNVVFTYTHNGREGFGIVTNEAAVFHFNYSEIDNLQIAQYLMEKNIKFVTLNQEIREETLPKHTYDALVKLILHGYHLNLKTPCYFGTGY